MRFSILITFIIIFILTIISDDVIQLTEKRHLNRLIIYLLASLPALIFEITLDWYLKE